MRSARERRQTENHQRAAHNETSRQQPEDDRRGGHRRFVGHEVAVARYHVIGDLLIALPLFHQLPDLFAHVGGNHRVRIGNTVVLAFRAAQLFGQLAELLLLSLIFKWIGINRRQRLKREQRRQ